MLIAVVLLGVATETLPGLATGRQMDPPIVRENAD